MTVESIDASRSMVRLTDPEQLLGGASGLAGDEVRRVAADTRARLERVTAALGGR